MLTRAPGRVRLGPASSSSGPVGPRSAGTGPSIFWGPRREGRLGEANSQNEWLSGSRKFLAPVRSNSRPVAVEVIPIRNIGRFGGRSTFSTIPFSTVLQTRWVSIDMVVMTDGAI